MPGGFFSVMEFHNLRAFSNPLYGRIPRRTGLKADQVADVMPNDEVNKITKSDQSIQRLDLIFSRESRLRICELIELLAKMNLH